MDMEEIEVSTVVEELVWVVATTIVKA